MDWDKLMKAGSCFTAVAVLDSLSLVLGKGIDLTERVKELYSVLPDERIILEKCSASELEQADLDRILKTLSFDHKRALEAALMCAQQVANLIWYAGDQERVERIKEGIERGDLTPLSEYMGQLCTLYLAKAEESNQDAERKLEDVRACALDLATDCKKKAAMTVTKTRIVVGVAEVAGVAAFAIVWFCTSGTVCLVLGGLTAVSTGVGIYCLPSCLKNGFRELSQLFDRVGSSANRMFDYTRAIAMYLKSISDMIDIVRGMMETHETHSNLIAAFDRLCAKCGGLNTSLHQQRMKKVTDEEFQAAIHEILQGHV